MIDVKTAVRLGEKYIRDIYGPFALNSLLVEEIELVDDCWLVTFGWDTDRLGTQRTYKVLKVRASDGEVLSMKIRTVA